MLDLCRSGWKEIVVTGKPLVCRGECQLSSVINPPNHPNDTGMDGMALRQHRYYFMSLAKDSKSTGASYDSIDSTYYVVHAYYQH